MAQCFSVVAFLVMMVPVISNPPKEMKMKSTPHSNEIDVKLDEKFFIEQLDVKLQVEIYHLKSFLNNVQKNEMRIPKEKINKVPHIFDQLEPCTRYNITVEARNTAKIVVAAGSSVVETLPGGPPEFKTFDMNVVSLDSVTVAWELEEPSCVVTSYYITYKGTKLWGNKSMFTSSSNVNIVPEKRLARFEKLQPYSLILVCIVASNDRGNGTKMCTANVTDEGTPSPPMELTATTVGFSNVTLTWQEPQHDRGVVRHYTVTWDTQSAMINRMKRLKCPYQTSVCVEYSDKVYTIEGLTEAEDYTVEVTASTGAGDGEAAWIHVSTGLEQGEAATTDVSTGAGQGEASRIDVSTGAAQGLH